jgi:hypothetical protein
VTYRGLYCPEIQQWLIVEPLIFDRRPDELTPDSLPIMSTADTRYCVVPLVFPSQSMKLVVPTGTEAMRLF